MRKEVVLYNIGMKSSGNCVVRVDEISKRFPLGFVLWRPPVKFEKLEASAPSAVSEDALDLYD